jgi:hypothetical protein
MLVPLSKNDGSPSRAPANVILLAAGCGSRIAAVAQHMHKSLLPVCGRSALERALDEILARSVEQVVIVTGYQRESIESLVRQRYGAALTLVQNDRFPDDMNILSVELGVRALRRPELGYIIVETDLVIGPGGWETVLVVGAEDESFWVTRGRYHRSLTGGALDADDAGRVMGLVYAPTYCERYHGWHKLLGILYVGPRQVAADCAIRRRAIEQTTAQYYMTPWTSNLPLLPCRMRPLGDIYAGSYNDPESYADVNRNFSAAGGRP